MKKTALITGGSRGIGFGIALELAKAGFDLAINGIREERQVASGLEMLRARGAQVIYIQGDVSDPAQRIFLVNQVVSTFGTLNVLINNAGIAPPQRKDLLEATEESYTRVMDINLKGPYFLTQLRLGEFEIPVYEIQPGVIKTDMTSAVQEKYDRLIQEGLLVEKRWGLPEDVGKVALSMVSGLLPYSTGQVVVVDGGLSIPRL